MPLIVGVVAAFVLVLCGGLVVLALIGAAADRPHVVPASTGPLSNDGAGRRPGHTVRFEVTSESGQASVINWSTVEDSALLVDQETPWLKETHMDSAAGLVGVNASAVQGTISCRVFVDGMLLDEAEPSQGAVNCSGTVR